MKKDFQDLVSKIYSGIRIYGYKKDDRIPSVRDLAHKYAARPSQISSALEFLIARQILYKKNRSGYFINKIKEINFPENSQAQRIKRLYYIFSSEDMSCSLLIRAAMRYLNRQTRLYRIPTCTMYTAGLRSVERKIMAQLLEETAAPVIFACPVHPANYDLIIEALDSNQKWLFAHHLPPAGIHVNFLGINDYQIGVLAAQRLLECENSKHILFIGDKPEVSRAAYLRQAGFVNRIMRAGSQVYHELLCAPDNSAFSQNTIRNLLQTAAKAPPKVFTASAAHSRLFCQAAADFQAGRDYWLLTVDYFKRIGNLRPAGITRQTANLHHLLRQWLLQPVDNSYQRLIYLTPVIRGGDTLPPAGKDDLDEK